MFGHTLTDIKKFKNNHDHWASSKSNWQSNNIPAMLYTLYLNDTAIY